MIRDRGPISSLGYGVTSRDVPLKENETEGPSPNSGYVAKALNGHPVMRFFASATATILGAYAAGRVIKSGGIRIATGIQRAAEGAGEYAVASSRFVESAGKIKKALDELEGVKRVIDGVDDANVYDKLIFEEGGQRARQTLVRLQGGYFEGQNAYYINTSEIRAAGAGITREPAAVWSLKDDIQQTLVKRARNLAIELPALYATQRTITDPLFGNNEDNKRKVHWYNPFDVVADFAKQTTKNLGYMLTPLDLSGAAVSRVKFLTNAPFSTNPNLSLTARQMKYANTFLDIKTILSEFGQDAEKVLSSVTRNTTSAAAAFGSSAKAAATAEGNPVFAMQQARRGAKLAAQASAAAAPGQKLRTAAAASKAFLFGHQIDTAGDPDFGIRLQGFIDALPGLKGATVGLSSFRTRFQSNKAAYDVLSGALAYDDALRSVSGGPTMLASSIKQMRSMHRGQFSDFAHSTLNLMGPRNLKRKWHNKTGCIC